MNKNARAQEQFVQIQEAYNVLGKPGSRAQYDSTVEIDLNNGYTYRPHVPYKWVDEFCFVTYLTHIFKINKKKCLH